MQESKHCASHGAQPRTATDRDLNVRAPPVQADEKFKKDKFVLSVAFSPDGRRLACGVMDGTVCLFDVPSGKLLHTLAGHHKPVRDVVFTPGAAHPGQLLHLAPCCWSFIWHAQSEFQAAHLTMLVRNYTRM